MHLSKSVEPYSETSQTQQIERAKHEWEVTVDALSHLVCLLDHQGRIIRANRTIERWQLGRVEEIKGQQIHHFLHPGCTTPDCYLTTLFDQEWKNLSQGTPVVEHEAYDSILKRYLHLQIQPLQAQSNQITEQDKASGSFAVLVLDDITKQKETETTLRQYALELKARNEELDAFAHTVAHNLKGPLLPIIGSAEMLETFLETMSAEAIKKDLDTISRSGHKISRIIDELLLLAGVRKMRVEMKPVNMEAVIHEVQQRLAHTIEAKNVAFALPDTWPIALGYEPWIEEVWANYFSNAIKYGGQPPKLTLGANLLKEEGKIRFWVQDNGPGLSPEEQNKLFIPFTQLNQVKAEGHGLGLSIVQRIVEKLGGEVGIKSENLPNKGCIFSFTLPSA